MRNRRAGGVVLIESTVAIPILIVLFLALVEFLLYIGAKTLVSRAAQRGLQVAVSDPAVTELSDSPEYLTLLNKVNRAAEGLIIPSQFVRIVDTPSGLSSVVRSSAGGPSFVLTRPTAPSLDDLRETLKTNPVHVQVRFVYRPFFVRPLLGLFRPEGIDSVVTSAGMVELDILPPKRKIIEECPEGGCSAEYCASDPVKCPQGNCAVQGKECVPCPTNTVVDPSDPSQCVCELECSSGSPEPDCSKCGCDVQALESRCASGNRDYACNRSVPNPSTCQCEPDPKNCPNCSGNSNLEDSFGGICLECPGRAACMGKSPNTIMNVFTCSCSDCDTMNAEPNEERTDCQCRDDPCPYGSSRTMWETDLATGKQCGCRCNQMEGYIPVYNSNAELTGCGCHARATMVPGGDPQWNSTFGAPFKCECNIQCPSGWVKIDSHWDSNLYCTCGCPDGWTKEGQVCVAPHCTKDACPKRRNVVGDDKTISDCDCHAGG